MPDSGFARKLFRPPWDRGAPGFRGISSRPIHTSSRLDHPASFGSSPGLSERDFAPQLGILRMLLSIRLTQSRRGASRISHCRVMRSVPPRIGHDQAAFRISLWRLTISATCDGARTYPSPWWSGRHGPSSDGCACWCGRRGDPRSTADKSPCRTVSGDSPALKLVMTTSRLRLRTGSPVPGRTSRGSALRRGSCLRALGFVGDEARSADAYDWQHPGCPVRAIAARSAGGRSSAPTAAFMSDRMSAFNSSAFSTISF